MPAPPSAEPPPPPLLNERGAASSPIPRSASRVKMHLCFFVPLGLSVLHQLQRPTLAQRRLSKRLQPMSHRVRQRQIKSIVRDLLQFHRTSHLEPKPSANHDVRNVIQR